MKVTEAIAREWASNYNMLEEYLMARKNGLPELKLCMNGFWCPMNILEK